MLVLSRKVGEKLVIDGNITVEVVRIQGNRITLGLVAPADVKDSAWRVESETTQGSKQRRNSSSKMAC
jgi:carbon storage regulator CsrA